MKTPAVSAASLREQQRAQTREDILRRMRNQIDQEVKMKLCDAVIVNDEQTAVIPQVLALHERLISILPAHP